MRNLIALIFLNSLVLVEVFSQQEPLAGVNELERLIERKAVPAEVLAAAVAAVQKVGDQTLRGDFEGVVEQTYGRFQKRAAKKLGSNEELAAKMRKLVDDYAASGIAITGFVAEPAMHGFDIPEFNEWLVFVPTTRTVRFIDPQTGLKQVKQVPNYQVAICSQKEGSSWSFLNGSTLKVQELRALFPSLPAGIEEWAMKKKTL